MVRTFKCKYPGCDKAYGSNNILGQHTKIKHPEYWKQIRESKEAGIPLTEPQITKQEEPKVDDKEYFFDDEDKITTKSEEVNRAFEYMFQD